MIHNPAGEETRRGCRECFEVEWHAQGCGNYPPTNVYPVLDSERSEETHEFEVRTGDIYRFRYNVAERKRLGFSADHCFEGFLHARELGGEIKLVDTYWGLNGDGRVFTLDEARRKGTLTFYCNLNDVEPIKDYEQVYYSDDDLFAVSRQHACVPSCVHWFKRKGAVRNAEKILRVISERIMDAESKARYATNDIQRFTEIREQVEAGNLEVYL